MNEVEDLSKMTANIKLRLSHAHTLTHMCPHTRANIHTHMHNIHTQHIHMHVSVPGNGKRKKRQNSRPAGLQSEALSKKIERKEKGARDTVQLVECLHVQSPEFNPSTTQTVC